MMKLKNKLFIVLIAFAPAFIACETTPEESCDSENFSDDFGCPVSVDAVATFCSDGVNKSYYSFRGSNYYCNSVAANTCDAANDKIAKILINDGCSTKKMGYITIDSQLSDMANELLNEVRLKSVCN